MASTCAAENSFLKLKEWFQKENTISEFVLILEEFHAILFGSSSCGKSTPLMKELGIQREGIVTIITSSNFHGQFCRLVFTFINTAIGKERNLKDIPWKTLHNLILGNITGSSMINLVDCFLLSK